MGARYRARSLVIAQRRSLDNAIRAHLAEFGIVGPQGRAGLRRLLGRVLDLSSAELPDLAREVIQELALQLAEAEAREAGLEARILAWHRANEVSRRLATIPGIGPTTASAIAATAPDPAQFTSGRHFAAWIGHVPRQHSTGGKERLGPISKRGEGYLRRLLVTGSQAVLRWMWARPANRTPWLTHMLERRPWNVGRDRTGEQSGKDRLGGDGPRRNLPEGLRGTGLNGPAAGAADLRV
jgi:transposase